MRSLVEKLIKADQGQKDVTALLLTEATVDFPREGLDPQIWDKTDSGYTLKDDVRDKIYLYIDSYPGEEDLIGLTQDLHVVGSSATNMLKDDADIDVHIIPDFNELPLGAEEALQQRVKEWSHKNPIYIGEHPVELYIQLLPDQEMMGDAVYDVTNDVWKKGPRLTELDYNPYEVFSGVMDQVRTFAKDADIELGELQRDVVDAEAVLGAIKKLPADYRPMLVGLLDKKLEEIEDNIRELMKDKAEWVELRRSASRPSEEEALDDIEVVRKWNDANAMFKFLDRYRYIKMITALEQLVADDTVTPDDISTIKTTLGMGR